MYNIKYFWADLLQTVSISNVPQVLEYSWRKFVHRLQLTVFKQNTSEYGKVVPKAKHSHTLTRKRNANKLEL